MYIINKNQEGYNPGMGCAQRDVKEKLRRLEGETGQRYEEVGNDSANVRPRRSSYEFTAKDLERVKHELRNIDG